MGPHAIQSRPNTPTYFRAMQFDQPAAPNDPHRRAWSGRLGVWLLLAALAGMFAAVSMLVFTTPLSRNDLGLLGGLRITTDQDTTVYVGDRRVGHGTVDVSWNELLGAAGRPPLAISVTGDVDDGAIPQILGAADAEVVWAEQDSTGTHRGHQDANFAFRQVLLRRDAGTYDHVFLVDCTFPNAEGQWQHVLLPIRTRQDESPAGTYYPQLQFAGGGNVNRGMIPSRRDHATFELKLTVDAGAPPSALAEQLAGATLWQPAGE